jgi:hypothetical protein
VARRSDFKCQGGRGAFVVAQMRKNHLLEVFDVFKINDDWRGLI